MLLQTGSKNNTFRPLLSEVKESVGLKVLFLVLTAGIPFQEIVGIRMSNLSIVNRLVKC